jgi:hypothetical protein
MAVTKSWKLTYPPEQGWIQMQLYMHNATALGEAEIKKLVLPKGEDPARTEWGPIEQHGKRIKVILRSPK